MGTFKDFLTEFSVELPGKAPTALANIFCQLGLQGPDDPYCCEHGWKCNGECDKRCDSFFNPVYNKLIHDLLKSSGKLHALRVVMRRDLGRNAIFAEDAYINALLNHFVKSKPSPSWVTGEDSIDRDPFDDRK